MLAGELHTLAQFLSCHEGSSYGQPQINHNYIQWKKLDRLLRGWIIGNLSEEALGLVISLEITTQVWQTLMEAYAQASQESHFQLQQQMCCMHKTLNTSLSYYLRNLKSICDKLATAIGTNAHDKYKVFSLLNSLGPKYEAPMQCSNPQCSLMLNFSTSSKL